MYLSIYVYIDIFTYTFIYIYIYTYSLCHRDYNGQTFARVILGVLCLALNAQPSTCTKSPTEFPGDLRNFMIYDL